MSWRDGDTILFKGIHILEEIFPEQAECAIYLSSLISVLCESDFDYIQFRESRTPHDKLLDYIDERDAIYDNGFSKIRGSVDSKINRRVLGHYVTVASRNIEQAELKRLKSSTAAKEKAFHALWQLSSEFIDDEEHLHAYTQSLISSFPFTNDDYDALAASNEALVPIVQLMKKDEEVAQLSLQKELKITKNLQELDDTFKKLEGRVKRSLTALAKRSKGNISRTPNSKEPTAPQPDLNNELLEEADNKPYSDPGFSASLNNTTKKHIQLVAEKTDQAECDVQAILQALEECILDDLERKDRTYLLTLIRMSASMKGAKPERMGINPFTGEEMLFKAKPGGLKVKALETRRLKNFLAIAFKEA